MSRNKKMNCHERNIYDSSERTQLTACHNPEAALSGKCSSVCCILFCSVKPSGTVAVYVRKQCKTARRSKEGTGRAVCIPHHRSVVHVVPMLTANADVLKQLEWQRAPTALGQNSFPRSPTAGRARGSMWEEVGASSLSTSLLHVGALCEPWQRW